MGEVVEDGETFEANALKKAREVGQATGHLALADDSGICVDALGGAPGVYSARYSGEGATDVSNNLKLLDALRGVRPEKRSAYYVAVVVLFDPANGETETVRAQWHGRIAESPRGKGGFGYDPIFVPDGAAGFGPEGEVVTSAEMDDAERTRVSHRGQAFSMLEQRLLRRTG